VSDGISTHGGDREIIKNKTTGSEVAMAPPASTGKTGDADEKKQQKKERPLEPKPKRAKKEPKIEAEKAKKQPKIVQATDSTESLLASEATSSLRKKASEHLSRLTTHSKHEPDPYAPPRYSSCMFLMLIIVILNCRLIQDSESSWGFLKEDCERVAMAVEEAAFELEGDRTSGGGRNEARH